MAFTSAAAASGGASQPAGAMQNLQMLNKSAALFTTFVVKCWGRRLVEKRADLWSRAKVPGGSGSGRRTRGHML